MGGKGEKGEKQVLKSIMVGKGEKGEKQDENARGCSSSSRRKASRGSDGPSLKKRAKDVKSCEDDLSAALAVSRCSRADLEGLILKKIDEGGIKVADVVAMLPETKRAVAAAAKPIENGRERCGTGRFDALDDALLTTIMMNVSFVHRLACTTSVCKAWRALRHNHPLWTELVVVGDDATFAGYRLEDFDKGVRCSNKGLQRLMSWLPSLSNVTNVSICTGKSISADTVKKTVQTLSSLTRSEAWADSIVSTRDLSLNEGLMSSLRLTGKKVTASVLKSAAGPCAARLKELHLKIGRMSMDDGSKEALKTLLRGAPLLEKLSLCPSFGMHNIRSTSRQARNGETSLITHMEIVNGFSFESVKFGDLALMGTHFPELESLTLRDLGKPFEGNLAVMPRLRRLHIDTLIARYSPTCIYLDKSELGSLITAVLEACPLLEDLSLCHGRMYISNKERKSGKTEPPLPTTNGSLIALPSSLRRLALKDMLVCPEELTADLPNLQYLRLDNVGAHTQEIMRQLRSKCPKLLPEACESRKALP